MAALQRNLGYDVTDETVHRELMRTYAQAGQRQDALRQYTACRSALMNELNVEPELQTTDLYQCIVEGDVRSFQPAGAVVSHPHPALPLVRQAVLPVPATPFYGRSAEVAAICGLVQRSEVRLVTLTGPGGIGKTRLALQVAGQIAEAHAFAHGIVFVALASLTDAAFVPATIAQAIGVKEMSGQAVIESVKFALRERTVFLILDNAEHLIGAAATIVDILAACPRVKVLVTSREVLRLSGEYVYGLLPFAVPGPDESGEPDQLQQYPSIALFMQRAQAVKPDFALTPDNARTIADICTRLDGLPLAIELAAARIKMLSPDAFLNRLARPFDILTQGSRDLPARHQTLHRTLEWSYMLMTSAEKILFARLAVFTGGATLETIEVVCAFPAHVSESDTLSISVFDTLATLVDKSLVIPQQTTEPGGGIETRFTMLETIRAYAQEHLTRSGEESQVRDTFVRVFRRMAEEIEPRLHSTAQGSGLRRLEREHANIRLALTWSFDAEIAMVTDGIHLTAALAWFWHVRGYWSEGKAWLEVALTKTGHGDTVRAKVLYGAGLMVLFQGDYALARNRLEECRTLCYEIGDRWGAAHALDALGELNRQQGNYAGAQPLYEQSLALCTALDDPWCANHEVVGLGFVNAHRGAYVEARAFFEQGLAGCRAIGDASGAARALNGLGELLHRTGEYIQAQHFYQESLALYRELGQTGNIALVLYNIGHTQHAQGDIAGAWETLIETLTISQAVKSRQLLIWTLAELAVLIAKDEEQSDIRRFQAARLFGAVDALLSASHLVFDPFDDVGYQRQRQTLSTHIGGHTFMTLAAEGAGLSIEHAIAIAHGHGS